MAEDFLERVGDEGQVVVVSYDVLKELTESQTPQGIVAEIALESKKWQASNGRFLILEDVQDPGTVGTMVWKAGAAGFDSVIVSGK